MGLRIAVREVGEEVVVVFPLTAYDFVVAKEVWHIWDAFVEWCVLLVHFIARNKGACTQTCSAAPLPRL